MLKRTYAPAVLLSIVVAVLSTFSILTSLDRSILITRAWVVGVFDVRSAIQPDALFGAITRFTDAHNASVARVVTVPDADSTRRVVYVSPHGDGSFSQWLRDGYPCFDCDIRTAVEEWTPSTRISPLGNYLVEGDEGDAAALQAALGRLGAATTVFRAADRESVQDAYAGSSTSWAMAATVLLVSLLVAATVMARAKRYGIQRLMGQSLARTFLSDQLACLRVWLVCLGCSLVIGLPLASRLNHLHHVGAFAAVMLGLCAAFFLLGALVWGLTLNLTGRTSLVDAIKGKMNVGGFYFGTYLLRGMAFVILTSSLLGVMQSVSDQSAIRETSKAFEGQDLSVVSLTKAGQADQSTWQRSIAEWVRDLTHRDQAVLAHPEASVNFWRRAHGGAGKASAHADVPVIYISPSYLGVVRVVDDAGARLTWDRIAGRTPVVLAPMSNDGLAVEAQERAAALARQMSEIAGADAPGSVALRPIATNQTFYALTGDGRPARLRGAVAVVFPDLTHVPDSILAGWATSDVMIRASALADAESAGVGDYVFSYRSVAGALAEARVTAVSALYAHAFASTLAVAVLLIAALGSAFLYQRKNSQSIFVQKIGGRPWIERYWTVVLVEVLLLAALTGWVYARSRTDDRPVITTSGQFQAGDWLLAVGSMSLVLAVLSIAVSVTEFDLRVLRRGAREVLS